MIGCTHELLLHKSLQPVPDSRPKAIDTVDSGALEYQLVTLPRLTSLLHGYQRSASSCSVCKKFVGRVKQDKLLLLAQSILATVDVSSQTGSPVV